MNSRPFTRNAQKSFRPAFDYLSNFSRPNAQHARDSKRKQSDSYVSRRQNSTSSLDDTDFSDVEQYAKMDGARRSHSTQNSLSELQPAVPLIDISSRSTSPYPRTRSATQSEDEDDYYEPASSIRPLVSRDMGRGATSWKGVFRQGGLGGFLFGTWLGWQIWVGLLVFWVGGCGFGLLLMNRFIMLTGVYKFPFPLTGTYIQLLLTHTMLITFSSLTRGLASPLRKLGLGAAVAPAIPVAPQGGAFRGGGKQLTVLQFGRWLSNGSGGIAGGGLFEFEYHVAKQVLPLAVIFLVKVLLSNFSFAYAPLPVYQLARIGVTPFAIIFSCILQKENHSGGTLSSALVATLNLLFATLRSNVRVTWESIVAGVFSSLFVALYPILLLRTYRILLAGLVPLGDVLTGYPSSAEEVGNREETRAYFRTLHYTSLLSLIILTPIVVLSGELGAIYHNIPFLDVPFFWFMIWCGALGSFAVFSSTLLLVKATSPLTATFIQVPRSAFQLVMLSMFKMPAHSWIGVVLCWISSVWFLVLRRNETRSKDRLKLEGR
ncbi:hypothetical protein P153DRAFT_365975 [Dothidotthia symphoricarpi CBS 119687]|uniref:GDP-mannose transporter n=1 Tax=Dothidotthia symphoricarpi CBS 119687 TaxID=1392245 RepID=A0A6A6AHJ3_9PLEO|nr:uncharacterized protein P153DRAFT_365975 [Dothidotthia symphoricarpi CBS 119687]KAF2130367.1 hypothetical protein P153DRAFT_365975 [Dothidotthia symphoricarpi CBS 119687]